MTWIRLGSLFMFLAVALGAFGAHALKDKLSGYHLDVYNKAVLYHAIHALALLIVGWLTTVHGPRFTPAGALLTLGIILFSGSLYALALTQIKLFGAVTPLGGLCFLAGWLVIFLSTFK